MPLCNMQSDSVLKAVTLTQHRDQMVAGAESALINSLFTGLPGFLMNSNGCQHCCPKILIF